MNQWKIPLFQPDLNDDDASAVLGPVKDQWLTMGERTKAFESTFADKIAAKYAFAVSSGTAALHLAVLSLEITPGDEIILPSLTFVACANVIHHTGAIPVFADCVSEDDLTISPDDIAAKITPKTKAIMVVHYAGFACDMPAIRALADQHNLNIIEDCAHALITHTQQGSCGTLGDVGCFSFFTNKNMSCGEGGMLTTNDDTLAEKIRLLRSHGMTTLTLDRHQGRAITYDVKSFGLNYRIDEIRSALGLSQLNRLDENLQKRRHVYQWYQQKLKDEYAIDAITIPFSKHNTDETGIHIYPIILDRSINREAFIQSMKAAGVQTSIHYPAIHQFTAYQSWLNGKNPQCPKTEAITAQEITLPFYPDLTEAQVDYIARSVRESVG